MRGNRGNVKETKVQVVTVEGEGEKKMLLLRPETTKIKEKMT